MATKKQKREAAQTKREKFMAEVEAEGLEAQKLDRTIRTKQREQTIGKAREINERHRAILANHGITN
jgi:hypothetical protein